jgi:hypothetical protein
MPAHDPKRTLNVCVAITDPSALAFGCSIVSSLQRVDHVAYRVISCCDYPRNIYVEDDPLCPAVIWHRYESAKPETNDGLVAGYCSWADLLVLAPLNAEDIARMLHGFTNNLPLQILRSWDVSKKILLVPGMSTLMWENPMSRKQISKIRRKWNWIKVLPPYLKDNSWDGAKAFNESIQTQVDLMAVGDRTIALPTHMSILESTKTRGPRLPPELWSIIMEFLGDWELATALHVHTSLPVPPEWRQSASEAGPKTPMQKLEWTLLVAPFSEIKAVFDADRPTRISRLCIEIIMRFAMVPILTHLEKNHKDLFWSTFGHAFLPHKASIFGKTEILEYWRTSPAFLTKEYSVAAVDNASRSGSVQALDWWYESGLPLKYTEAALEQASSRGHIPVLQWWKDHSTYRAPPASPPAPTDPRKPLKLKVGKSITYATQAGCLPSILFWHESLIPFSHEDTIAKLASTHGHTHILDYLRRVRGEKMLFDNQVLAGPTKMGHADVLEWWKMSGLRVEYKTCDIEEALEDGVEGAKGEAVTRWWARNGLNLGVGTSEWMKVKVLGS